MVEKIEAIFSEYGKLFIVGVIGHIVSEKLHQSFNNFEIRVVWKQKDQSDSFV